MTSVVIAVCVAIAFLTIRVVLGLRRIERLKAPYCDNAKLILTFDRVGGPRRACTAAGLELARRLTDRLPLAADFDRYILAGVGNNFSHPGAVYATSEAREMAQARLTTYAHEEAERARVGLLENAATFLCCMYSDRALARLADQQTPKLEKNIAEACYWLTAWTMSGCVGAAVGRLRAEGGMHA